MNWEDDLHTCLIAIILKDEIGTDLIRCVCTGLKDQVAVLSELIFQLMNRIIYFQKKWFDITGNIKFDCVLGRRIKEIYSNQ